MVKALIAEDDVQTAVHLSNVINFTKEVQAISIINDGTEVYKAIKKLNPEIAILEPKLLGEKEEEILQEIEEDSGLNTRIVIYSKEQECITKAIGFSNVEGFFDKSETCEEIGLEIQKLARKIENNDLSKKIYDTLLRIGFRADHKGTRFIKECIEIAIKEKQENLKKIYARLAETKGKNSHTIKADIQGAVDKMWKYANKEIVRKFLRMGECDKPSPKLVISMVRYYMEK